MQQDPVTARPRRLTALLAGSAAVLALASAGSALAGGPDPGYRSIESAGPLTRINVDDEGRCQVAYEGVGQIYSPGNTIGDCRTIVALDGGSYQAYLIPQAQGQVYGAGTMADPFRVRTVTTLQNEQTEGPEHVTVTQEDSYVTGDEFWTVSMSVWNRGTEARTVRLYRYWDCYLGSDDSGYGFENLVVPGAVGCSLTPNNSPSGLIEGHIPSGDRTPNRYFEGNYKDARDLASHGETLPDTCNCEIFEDNGAVIGWEFKLAPGQTLTRTVREVFSPDGDIPNPDALPDATTEFGISPGTHDFGGVSAGATSTPETFEVNNVGATAMTVNPGGITLGGTNPSEFKITGGTCADGVVVGPAKSCTVTAMFAPTGTASVSAKLQVTTTDGTRSAVISGRAPNLYDVLAEAEKSGTALKSITPVKRVVARGTRAVRATVNSGLAAQGTVALHRCLNASCTRYVKITSKVVNFKIGSQTVTLKPKVLPPGRYQWLAAMGPSEVTGRMLVRGAVMPVTG